MSKADKRNDITVDQYIDSIGDEQVKEDARKLCNMMHQISGEEPILYGIGTIGYGVYRYEYQSGRKGEAHTLGFYPRKGKITVYLMDGTKRYAALLSKLGRHTTTGYCIYIKQLSDVEAPVLTQILTESYEHITTVSSNGVIDRILWQDEK
jgi:hypothetical protein